PDGRRRATYARRPRVVRSGMVTSRDGSPGTAGVLQRPSHHRKCRVGRFLNVRSPSSSSRRTPRLLLLTAGVALILSGCSAETVRNGFLPSEPGVTNKTEMIIDHWNGAWVAALFVGVLVWGLTIWCVVAYRKRKNDDALPVQLRYHVPLELMYTIIPILMVGVLFFYSSRVTGDLVDVNDEPDLHIQVYGKQ